MQFDKDKFKEFQVAFSDGPLDKIKKSFKRRKAKLLKGKKEKKEKKD